MSAPTPGSEPDAAASLLALSDALREHGGTVAGVLATDATDAGAPSAPAPGPAQAAAAGPRTRGHEREYELLVEMILEGSLLHYGEPRVVRPGDPVLALLLGDQLYALGLSRLAMLGDLDAVGALADVIADVARSNASGEPGRADEAWVKGARRVAWGAPSDEG